MFQTLKKKLKDQRGLTLIELLAVIVIIGIIAAIAIPSISNLIQKSRVDAVQADALSVLNSAKLYQSQNPEDSIIRSAELDEFVDNVGLTAYSISVDSDGTLKLTADGKAGNVTIDINAATYEDLNKDASWKTVTDGTIVIGADTGDVVTTE